MSAEIMKMSNPYESWEQAALQHNRTSKEGYPIFAEICVLGELYEPTKGTPTSLRPLITHSPVIRASLTCSTVEIQPPEPLLVKHAPSTVA